jgi:hypothetical protein
MKNADRGGEQENSMIAVSGHNRHGRMFKHHRVSHYTGLACHFSFLIREHGVETIYKAVLDSSKSYSSGPGENHKLSDALGKLAIAISSRGVKDVVEGIPIVKKAWRKKTNARLEAWEKLLEIADQIDYKKLGFFFLMEIPAPPFNLRPRAHLLFPEPVSKIKKRLEQLLQNSDEYSWYPFEKFVLSEYPDLIQSQIELYEQLIVILQTGVNQTNNHELSILRVKKGAVHKVAELGQHYEVARCTLPELRKAIERFERALKEELNGSRLWDETRTEIEKNLPDELGHIINYETIKEIESKVESLAAEG